MDKLIENNKFAVPDFIVERQMDSRFNALLQQLYTGGIDPRQMRIDWSNIREAQRERAESEGRGMFILESIAEKENIEVSDDDINEEIEPYADSRGESIAAAKARLTKEDALDSIKEQVRHQKALDLVIASADLKTEEVEGLRDAAADQAGEGADTETSESATSSAESGNENAENPEVIDGNQAEATGE